MIGYRKLLGVLALAGALLVGSLCIDMQHAAHAGGETAQLYVNRTDVVGEQAQSLPVEQIKIERAQGQDDYYFEVEIATTPEEQAKGLMYRDEIPLFGGMLFVFPEEKMRSFWMKNTFIPLDLIFLRKNGYIHHIHHDAVPQDLTHITSKYPSMAVLEIKGGTADKLGISEGDFIRHRAFKNTNLD